MEHKTRTKALSWLLSLALVLGLMPGMSLTAYAAPTEELLTTITATGKEQANYSTSNVATVSFSYSSGGSSAYLANWGWWGYGWTATVTPADGYTITKCVFYDNIDNNATDSEAPFVVETAEDDKIPKVNGSYIYPYSTSAGVKKIEVYGYATPAPALDPVSYMAWNGTTLVEKTGEDACTDYTVVTADTTTFEDGKWYVVSDSVTVSSRITVTGTAHLILCDGATLTASKGITVNSGNTINIYSQSAGTGNLISGASSMLASIGGGGRGLSSGTVNIHGGKITATGGSTASGIGGALEGGNGEVNIYSGEVTAQGQNFAAGIGGYSGKSGGTVNIYGGTVNASGKSYGTPGIGIGGTEPGSCVVHIYGGEVTATSEKGAAGIQGTVTIDGGTVTANGGGDSNSIDCNSGETYSSNGINGTVTINGGTVTATGGNVTVTGFMSAIESSRGGTIYACSGISGTVTISGGTVRATGGNVTGEISNRGGNIYACNGINGTVTISGGTVTTTGGSHTGQLSSYGGTTVKEKGFGGSLTLGTGMYLYGGTSANPESNLSNHVPQNNGDYARSRYMTVNNVAPHTHSFTYSATGATITATCTAGCDITEGLALTISAPTELTYDGSAKAATLSTGYNTTAFPGEYMIKYYKGANEVEAANVKAAGDYTAKVTVGEATASVDFTIAKATPSIETIPTASAITYGQKLADSALTGGAAKLGDTTVAGTFAWKSAETKPSVSDSNTTEYAVMFNPTDTDNYAAVECKVKLTVNRAEPTVTVPTAKTPTYNGSAQELVNAGSATGGTMYYAVTTENTAPTDESLYTASIPTKTNAGTYYVWYKVVGDENHFNTEPASVTVTISMATPTLTEPTLEAVTYDPSKTLANIALTGGWTWVTETTVPTVGNTGYTAEISVDDANYDYTGVEGYDATTHKVARTMALTVNKAEVTAPTIASKTYNKQNQTADVPESTLYTVTTNNGGIESGDYNVVLALTDADNYKWSDSDEAEKTLIFSITKATNNTVSVSIEGWTYGDAANAPTAASDFGTPVITYAVKDSGEFTNEVPTDAGVYTVKATVAETANYKGGEATADFTIAKVPAPTLTATQKPTADGATMKIGVGLFLVKAPEETVENYTVKYSLDGESWSEELPIAATIGRFDVFVKYDCDDNHTPFDGETVYVSTIPARVAISDESILGKSDGRLYFVPNDIVYKIEGDAEYTPVTHTFEQDGETYYDIVDLAAGTYYFHYVASGNYPESEDYYVVIDAGKPITARYISDGEVLEELTGLSYGAKLTKPADPVKEGYKFVGWRYNDKLWSFDNELDSIGDYDFETDEYYYRIEAQWTKKSIISGVITDENGDPVNNAIVRINDVEISSNENGRFALAVEDGEYNITASDLNSSVTRYIKVEGDTEVNIQLAANKITFVDNENAGKYEAVVGGLEDVIEAEPVEAGQTVFVELAIIFEANINDGEKAVFDEGKAAIKQLDETRGKSVEYFDLMLRKTVSTETDDVVIDLGSTNTKLLTIIIPFSTTGKTNIAVYRYHGGEAIAMEENPEAGSEGYTLGDNSVTIYAKSFSTYAIGYNNIVYNTISDYSVTTEKTENGTLKVSAGYAASGSVVTVTAAPDAGYRLAELTVKNAAGETVKLTENEDGTYSFTMPASSVTVSAKFVGASCPKDETCPISEFTDADANAWYHDGVHFVLENKLMSGYGDGKFGPADYTSRAMVAQILWNLEGKSATSYEMNYTDVADDAWYANAIRWASEKGIVTGYGDGKFGPDDNITREQLAAIIYRYAQSKGQGFTGMWMFRLDYEDAASISDWASEAMHWMVMKGIIKGQTDKTLAPKSFASRAEIATMIMRYAALEK